MEYLFYLLKMPLIKRKARVIPFGYKLADDTNYIEPVQEELDALREAKEYLNNCSYREVAKWLTTKAQRYISYVGLKKRITRDSTSEAKKIKDSTTESKNKNILV
mgnify:CR=1 FL=1